MKIKRNDLNEIITEFNRLKKDNEYLKNKNSIFREIFNLSSSLKEDLEKFIYLCEYTSMYDKVGDTYYNALKALGKFSYN